jgi:hypothetical protein
MPATDVVKVEQQSVTHSDGGGAFVFSLWGGADGNYSILPYELPVYGSQARDAIMRSLLIQDGGSDFGDAVTIAASQIASQGWEVESSVPRRARRAQDIIHEAELNDGWVAFVSLLVQDWLCTDNGAWIELIREKNDPRAPIIGLKHLDSLRCWRTGDSKEPVWYLAADGYHRMQWWQVINLVSMQHPDPAYYGRGRCAASRCYRAIHKLHSIDRLVGERLTGVRPQKLDLITGVTTQMVEDAVTRAKAQAQSEGYTKYLASVIMGMMTDATVNHIEIPFTSLPENFDAEKERREAKLRICNAVGILPTDLDPEFFHNSLGGTGQAIVIEKEASGRQIALFRMQLTHQLNQKVFDDQTTFVFVTTDLRDEQARANINETWAKTVKTNVDSGVLTPQQGLQMLVDEGKAPPEFLAVDETPTETLDDTEKPEMISAATEEEESSLFAVKEVTEAEAMALIEQEMAHAIRLYEEVR